MIFVKNGAPRCAINSEFFRKKKIYSKKRHAPRFCYFFKFSCVENAPFKAEMGKK